MRMQTSIARQRGAALLVAMVMIFMLSIMGISAMRTATLEKQMTSNAIQSSVTLHAAESATEEMLNNRALLAQVSRNKNDILEVDIDDRQDDIDMEHKAQIVYLDEGLSFGDGSGFISILITVQADSQIADARSRSIVRQGARIRVVNPYDY